MSTGVVPNGRLPYSRRWAGGGPLRVRRRSKSPSKEPALTGQESAAALRLPLPRKSPVPRLRRKKLEEAPRDSIYFRELRQRADSVRPLVMIDSPGFNTLESTASLGVPTSGLVRTTSGLGRSPSGLSPLVRTPSGLCRTQSVRTPRPGAQGQMQSTGALLAAVLLGAGTPLMQPPTQRSSDCCDETIELPELVSTTSGAGMDSLDIEVVGGNTPQVPPAKSERRESRATSLAPPTLTITEPEYVSMKRQFEAMDVDGTGDLTWSELQSMSAAIGIYVDYRTFKLMDKDRSGTVDFEEMLRMFYPRARKADLRWAAKHWGEPHEGRSKQEAEEQKKKVDWTDMLTEEALKEVREIFYLYCTSSRHPQGVEYDSDGEAARPPSSEDKELRLSRAQLRRMLRHNPHINEEDVDRFIEQHGRSKSGSLNLEEFAELLSDNSQAADGVGVGGQRRHVKYSFVDPPPPMPEF